MARFGEPVGVLKKLCYCFKGIQLVVFASWCFLYGQGSLLAPGVGIVPLAAGLAMILAGQALNFGVFYRLGNTGVFYGNRFGYEIPWCRELPFSLLKHPQYAGALFTIWGFFVALRFPYSDWYVLPSLETVYYVLGAYFESEPPSIRTDARLGADQQIPAR